MRKPKRNKKSPKNKISHRTKIILLTVVFIIASMFLIQSSIESSSPEGNFIGNDQPIQSAYTIGLVLILSIILVGIVMHYITKFAEDIVKK